MMVCARLDPQTPSRPPPDPPSLQTPSTPPASGPRTVTERVMDSARLSVRAAVPTAGGRNAQVRSEHRREQ
eukprot:1177620-Prorocentrum_minimum.AAC.9